MLPDPWLDRWIPLLKESAGGRPVLEIGCGTGDDTVTLVDNDLPVVAFDISKAAAATAKLRAPRAEVSCRDVRDPFPVAGKAAGAVVASLTLHYFSWGETLALVSRIHETLHPGGLFLCRLNSTEDRNFGAGGHECIEPNYFMVDGQPKRFFDEKSVDDLFCRGWKILSKEHLRTRKYVRAKALWELALRPGDA